MNVSELIERLRTHWESQRKAREADAKYDACCVDLGDEAADALEAQAREIADLQAGWRRTYDHDVARLQERLAAAERERDKWIEESARLGYNAEQFKAERDEAVALLREVRMGVKNSAVEFGYPYTEHVDSIDALLAKIKEGGK